MEARSFSSPDADAERIRSALTGAGFEVGAYRPVRRTLLDTFDGRLHAAGLRLEVREAEKVDVILSDGGPAPARAVVDAVPRVAGDVPPGPLRSRLGPLLDVRVLLPVLVVDALQAPAVRRNVRGKAVVEVALYTRVTCGTDAAAGRWVAEIHPYEGYPAAADRAAKLLRSLGLSPRQGGVVDLVAAEAGVDLRGFAGSPTVALDPSDPATVGFRRVLVNLAASIDANWQGTVDDLDPEFLHDLRVAVRRTRSVLSNAKRVLPTDGRRHFRTEFGWLGAVTTPCRDLDVYLIEWPGYVAPLAAAAADLDPVVAHIARRRTAEHGRLADTLRSNRYRSMMDGWRAWIDTPPTPGGKARKPGGPIGPVVAARLADAQDCLLARGRAIDQKSPPEALHELRKDAKKLRYLLECFGGVLPSGGRKSFVSYLKALQDNLGEHQDTEVHTAQLRNMSEELHAGSDVGAETFLAMGRLIELFDQRRVQAREMFAERFTAYDTDATARALRKLIEAAGKR